MVVTSKVGVASWVLVMLGFALLVLGFFLIVPADRRSSVAWLDLTVCGAVFLVNFSNLSIMRLKTANFSEQIPRLGMLWTAHTVYTGLALGGVWRGWLLGSTFEHQLLYQLVLLFGMLVLISSATKASGHAEQVAVIEKQRTGSLDSLKGAVADCQSAFLRLGAGSTHEYSQFQRIQYDIRYLSPSDNPEATSLDFEISGLIRDLTTTMQGSTPNAGGYDARTINVKDTLARCQDLLWLRKQLRQECEHT